jgi:hypothetical protein
MNDHLLRPPTDWYFQYLVDRDPELAHADLDSPPDNWRGTRNPCRRSPPETAAGPPIAAAVVTPRSEARVSQHTESSVRSVEASMRVHATRVMMGIAPNRASSPTGGGP